jgi:putative salt-induced outer membrane protein YdiY
MKKVLFPLFLSIYLSNSYAFLNIEALRQSEVSNGLSGGTRFELNQQKGNVDKIVMNFSTLNQYRSDKNNFLFIAAYQYGESFSEVDNRSGHLHFRYTYSFSKKTFLEFFQQTEFNKFQDLNSRILVGTGLRRQIFEVRKLSLYVGAGAFYEREKIESQADQENPRGNIYLSLLKSVAKDYSISSTLYYQPNIENTGDNRFRLSIGLESTFGENFTQSIEYSLRRDSLPPIGISKTDSSVTAGLGYNY